MIISNNISPLPSDMDKECIRLCQMLNRLPKTRTSESCCGHLRERYCIWFHCDSLPVLTRLARAVERNYSDNRWELVVDSCDTSPYGYFCLRSKNPFSDYDEMMQSVRDLIQGILWWFKDDFDEYFSKKYKHN